jgi:mono/diheme cytochrome c family protein
LTGRGALLLAALAGTALAVACASVPLPERQGVVLYRKKCGACHRPYAPSEIKPGEWEKTIAEMKKRAKLTDAEVAEIRSYVEVDLVPSHPVARVIP